MLSDKARSAIERLSAMSPTAKKIAANYQDKVETISAELEAEPEEMTSQQLLEDNIKLKNFIVSLSSTITALESTVDDLTDELDALQDTIEVSKISDKTKNELRKFITGSSTSYLLQVYGTRQSLSFMPKRTRAFLCTEMIDKFNEHGVSDKIPTVWHNVVSTDGEL